MAENTETSAADAGLEDLRQDLAKLRADFARLIENLGKETRETVGAASEDAADAVEAKAGHACSRAHGYCKSLRESVRAQPLVACALAAGVGVIFGQLLLRR